MGFGGRKDTIQKAIKFLKMFYHLTPKETELTISQIGKILECSRTNTRHWIDIAGDEIPIYVSGENRFHNSKGPAGKTYGILRGE